MTAQRQLPTADLRKVHLTIIPGRSGADEKLHRSLGLAKQAVSYQCGSYGRHHPMSIWAWDFEKGEWSLLYDIPAKTNQADLPWKKENTL
ncbi:hypothetical protein [Arthrobacter sp. 31Y]|uniref:hypothetical protein n=1 Tax=Arthrobacter sp. 31Y TaxID=1115632 RepID=UPI00046474EF|nr:hypothetical protein [Arthrobacter sp. 31Y]